MLIVALSTLRSRWTTFVTGLLTLTLGVALIAAAGVVIAGTVSAPDRPPRRYAAGPVVVTPLDELRVNGRVLPLVESHGLPPAVVDRVRGLGPAVVDRAFPIDLRAAGPDATAPPVSGDTVDTGRPWAAARLGRYRLVSGRAPRDAGEIAVPGSPGGPVVPGTRVTVRTTDESRVYTVVGLIAPVSFERAAFFTDAEAARLSPRIDALVPSAAAADVRSAVGDDARVVVGAQRRDLDPDHRADTEALIAANSVVGTAAGVSGFVAVFVIASTFAYAVATRRRELALLRTAGATPGQIRRSVVLEGLLIGVLGSVAGCQVGRSAAPWMASWLVDNGLAPQWFRVPDPTWPFVVAFVAGVLTALLGVVSAAHRAGLVRPVEALRETAVEPAPMTPGRWLAGLVTLGGALYLLGQPVLAAPADALKRKHYLPTTMLLLVGLALLAPLLVPPVARLVGRSVPGIGGLLARQAMLAAARRTASVAAPVLLTAGLAASVLTVTATVDAAKYAEELATLDGDFAVVPTGPAGLGSEVVARLRAVPGVRTNTIRSTVVYAADAGATVVRHTAHAVDRPVGLPVLAGDPGALDDDSVVVDAEFGWSVGDDVELWLADGSPLSLRVVAVVRDGVGGNGAFVTGRHAGRAPVEQVQVTIAPGADAAVAARGIDDAVRGRGAEVLRPHDRQAVARSEWARGHRARSHRAQTLGLRVILGLAILLAVLSIVGTTVLAGRDRLGESAVLGLVGGTPAQVVRAACVEATFVAAVGLVLAALAAVCTAGALWLCLLRLVGRPMAVVVPWGPVAGVAAVCLVATVLATLAPTLIAVRRRRRRRPLRRCASGKPR